MRTDAKVADRLKRLALGLLAGLTLAVATTMPAAADFVIIDLGTLGGTYSTATGINDVGQVVGVSSTAGDAAEHAFLWQSGGMTDLGTLGGTTSWPSGINGAGRVVGSSQTVGNAAVHAFLWQDGRMADLNNLIPADSGWLLLGASSINDAGQIVGWGIHDGEHRAFLWQSGVITDLGTLGGTWSSAVGINNAGQIVGFSTDFFSYRSILFPIDLNSLIPAQSGWWLEWGASAINNAGRIVGGGSHNGKGRAFLLIPQ